jgi:CheY-like chemotaxis protein
MLRSLLLSQDEGAVRVLTRLLRDLKIEVEHHTDPHAAVQRLEQGIFDAIIVDGDDHQSATLVLQTTHALPSSRTRLVVVLARAPTDVLLGFGVGAHIALYKPISVERVGLGLRAVRNLMARERRRASERIPVKIPATLGRAGSGTPVVIVDLSDGGAAILGGQPLPSAGLLTLDCLLPDTTDPFIATAEVVWQDTQGQSGIRFVNVAFTSRHILVEWLKAQSRNDQKPTGAKAAANGRK